MLHYANALAGEPDSRLRFVRVPPSRPEESLASAVQHGLSRRDKRLPSRFFYDVDGSRLFERITRLPEYYLTRCETEILARSATEIIECCAKGLQIIEFGSGSSEKTKLLLRAAVARDRNAEYVPIDISAEFLKSSAEELMDEVDGVRVTAFAADYFDALGALPLQAGARLFLFLGSSIGNFDPIGATRFLRTIRKVMRPQDRLLVGADLKKPPEIVEPAYNDAEGVTEEFNKNMLVRVNRELCGHFVPGLFEHCAPWVEEKSRIEMRLVSTCDQQVSIDGIDQTFKFSRGEYIHTENSHKWSEEEFVSICERGGLTISRTWKDGRGWFALHLLQCAGPFGNGNPLP